MEAFPSEARRSNSFIKTQKQFGEGLHHLINERGSKSDLFPNSVKDLLELESQLYVSRFSLPAGHSLTWIVDPKIVELIQFYGVKDPDPNLRALNLNWFLREIGVTYQYVY